ncbi:signal peptidase II [Microbacterium sp. NPDC080220]|uniref:signal peptidase II n=1 Tax=Microbacterium sp. NPDC080220 TaxID=3161017 RepID=UPI0034411EDC
MALFFLAITVAALTALVDQATKANALTELSLTERIPLVGDLFGLQLAFNPGTVMSLGADITWVLVGGG